MRLIQVMHAVFQINNKWLGKKVTEYIKSLTEMASGQYRCRKHHRANLCCLNKTLVFDEFQIHRSSGIYVTVDATGCFDCICHAAVILTLWSFGLVATFAQTLFEVLQRSMHSIQTGFGVSSPLYGNEHPSLQDTVQGNGLAPTCFALLSCKMFRCKERAGHGLHVLAAISLLILRISGFDLWTMLIL